MDRLTCPHTVGLCWCRIGEKGVGVWSDRYTQREGVRMAFERAGDTGRENEQDQIQKERHKDGMNHFIEMFVKSDITV